MDEEAWQAVRAHAVARRAHQKASRFLPRTWPKTFFAQWRHAVRPDSKQRRQELLWDVEGLARLNLHVAWCRYGMDAQAKAARDATWQAKANQHQRELMKEFGENCAEFSEAEHLTKVQADKQAAPVLFTRSPTDTCVSPGTEREWEDALHALSKPKSGRAFGPDAIPSELIAAGGQGYRRALGVLCAKVSKEGAPMLWKGGDMAAFPRKPGPLTPSNTRGVVCSNCPGKMYARVLRAAAVPWLPLSAGMSQTGGSGGTEFAIMTRSLFSSWAQLRKFSSAVIFVDIRKAFYSVLVEEVVGPVMEPRSWRALDGQRVSGIGLRLYFRGSSMRRPFSEYGAGSREAGDPVHRGSSW